MHNEASICLCRQDHGVLLRSGLQFVVDHRRPLARAETMSRQEVSRKPAIEHAIEDDVLRVVISGLIGVPEIVSYAKVHIKD